MRLRYGAISSHFLGKAFETEWISSLAVIPASHSPQQASEPARTTQDICGLGSQMELGLCVPESAFSRTSRATFRWDFPASSATWKSWVIEQRGAYLARLNAVRFTRGSGSLFLLPTPTALEFKDIGTMELLKKLDRGGRIARRLATLNLQTLIGRVKVSVDLLEQMMGVPPGWTECIYSETEWSQLQQH